MSDSCSSCRFAVPGEETNEHRCHRFPPVVRTHLRRDRWPLVHKDDWCGEYIAVAQLLELTSGEAAHG